MDRYKVINLVGLVLFVSVAVFVNFYVSYGYCINRCSIELMRGLVNPVAVATPILSAALLVLIFFPSDLFRRWLWYCGGPLFVLFVWEVAGVATRGGSIAAPTRVGMAELLAQVYVGVTVLFIVGYYVWRRYKKSE